METQSNPFHPYTESEYLELKETFRQVTNYLPDPLIGWAWDNYKRISGSREPQPCACGSSAALWKRAVDTIREFINKKEGTTNG